MQAELKIGRCITRLAIHHPFFGAVGFRLDIHEDNSPYNPTMCTDGKFIKWNRAFVDRLSEDEVAGVMVHEIYHVVLKHSLRRGEREPERWNIAADLTINPMVIEGGFVLPKGGLFDAKYDGKWFAERVYEDLPPMPTGNRPTWGGVVDQKDKTGRPLSPSEKATAEAEIDEMVQHAADHARKAGKLPGNIETIIKEMAESQIDWQDKFQRFAGGTQPDDYTRRRYNKRYYAALGAVAPVVERVGVGDIAIGWDVSGSVSDKEHTHFLGELNAFIEDAGPSSVTIVFCDTRVLHVQRLEQGEILDEVAIRGKGGTKVEPVFDYIEEHCPDIERMVFLTDMGFYVDADKYRPHYPVMWLSTVAGEKAPFGEITYVKVR